MTSQTPILIPKKRGKIARQTTPSGVYIHYVLDRDYDKEKKYSVPKRVSIGRVCDDNPAMMIPNERFFEHFPEYVVPAPQVEAVRCTTLQAGSHIVIRRVVREFGLDKMLRQQFGEDAGLILDFAAYQIVDEQNQGQHYPDYAYRHPLFTDGMQVYSDSSVSRLLNKNRKDSINNFLSEWNENRDHKSCIYISYDSTNKNSQAGDIDLIEFGKAKDAAGLPIFNLALAFDVSNQIPLFYETYPGSINDVSQLKAFVDKAIAFNYRNIGVILDRGYFSKSNIEYLDEKGYRFVMMVKGCKELVSEMVDQNRGSFEHKLGYAIGDTDVVGMTVQRRLYEEDSKDRYFHLCFCAARMAHERSELRKTIASMKAAIERVVGTEASFGAPYTTYFEFFYEKPTPDKSGSRGKLLFAKLKDDVYERETLRAGYFCIITSEEMTAEEAYDLYRGRDASEKLFQADKTFLGGRSMRVHSREALENKTFIEFIALIIRNQIYNLLKNEMRKLNVRKNFMSTPGAIRELEKIEISRVNHGRYQLDHAISKNQEIILRAFGISKDEVLEEIGKLSKALADSDRKMSAHPIEVSAEEEYGEEEVFELY